MNQIMQFFGYVFCFWASWKVLDKVLHIFSNKKENTQEFCNQCEHQKTIIDKLQTHVKFLESKLLTPLQGLENKLDRANNKLDRANPDVAHVLNFANKAEVDNLKEQLGTRRANSIINKRPFTSVYDAETRLGTKTMAILMEKLKDSEQKQ